MNRNWKKNFSTFSGKFQNFLGRLKIFLELTISKITEISGICNFFKISNFPLLTCRPSLKRSLCGWYVNPCLAAYISMASLMEICWFCGGALGATAVGGGTELDISGGGISVETISPCSERPMAIIARRRFSGKTKIATWNSGSLFKPKKTENVQY